MKYLLRLVVLPLYILIISIFFIKEIFINSYYFIVYGGEVIVYTEDSKTINDVYQEIKEMVNNQNTEK